MTFDEYLRLVESPAECRKRQEQTEFDNQDDYTRHHAWQVSAARYAQLVEASKNVSPMLRNRLYDDRNEPIAEAVLFFEALKAVTDGPKG